MTLLQRHKSGRLEDSTKHYCSALKIHWPTRWGLGISIVETWAGKQLWVDGEQICDVSAWLALRTRKKARPASIRDPLSHLERALKALPSHLPAWSLAESLAGWWNCSLTNPPS